MARALPILLILWALGAVGYALLKEDPAPDAGPGETPAIADEQDPSLATRGSIRTGPLDAVAADNARQRADEVLRAATWDGRDLDLEKDQEAIRRFLRSATSRDIHLVRRLLTLLRSEGVRAHAVLGALLDYHLGAKGQPWHERTVLRTLLAVGPEDPRVRARLRDALRAPDGTIRLLARGVLFRGPTEEVLAFLDTASASARIEGATILLARGVGKELLIEHVLAGLRGGGPGTRTRAIQLLGKVGRDVAEVLPVVEEHFASDDKQRWLSGVQALGALATVPGDKEPVIRRLLEVGRRPDVRVRTSAVQAILMHDAQPTPVIELLSYLLDDADAGVRAEAVDGLGELSAGYATAKRALERARTDPNPQVRELVVYWLDEDEDD